MIPSAVALFIGAIMARTVLWPYELWEAEHEKRKWERRRAAADDLVEELTG